MSNVRELLTALGIGHFNATSMIQDMFIAPSTSDPRSPQIIQLVQHIQGKLVSLGAPIAISGRIDPPTTAVLVRMMGRNVLGMPWFRVVKGVLDAEAAGVSLAPAVVRPMAIPAAAPLSGLLDAPPGLPAVPGGLLTYGVGAYFLYKHFKKRA
jgi:hypothetical protein